MPAWQLRGVARSLAIHTPDGVLRSPPPFPLVTPHSHTHVLGGAAGQQTCSRELAQLHDCFTASVCPGPVAALQRCLSTKTDSPVRRLMLHGCLPHVLTARSSVT